MHKRHKKQKKKEKIMNVMILTLYRSVSAQPLQMQRCLQGRISVSLMSDIQMIHSAPFSSPKSWSLFSIP